MTFFSKFTYHLHIIVYPQTIISWVRMTATMMKNGRDKREVVGQGSLLW